LRQRLFTDVITKIREGACEDRLVDVVYFLKKALIWMILGFILIFAVLWLISSLLGEIFGETLGLIIFCLLGIYALAIVVYVSMRIRTRQADNSYGSAMSLLRQ